MDFARKQLQKYGWTDGKGLGKNENGISEALKTKMKRSVTGLGHDAAADFTEHWWTTLYDKAAGNVKVEDKNGKTKRIKTTTEDFEITNNEWKLKRKKKDENSEDEYSSFFVKKAVLSNGGAKTEQLGSSDSEEENNVEVDKKDALKMTDEELFAACGGRTAHKGARHGLRALGKLARIEQQEKQLLNEDRFEGYSNKKKSKQTLDTQVEDINLNSDGDTAEKKSKKKKKKHCSRENFEAECENAEANETKNKRKLPEVVEEDENSAENGEVAIENEKKQKKSRKQKIPEDNEINCETSDKVSKKKKKKDKVSE